MKFCVKFLSTQTKINTPWQAQSDPLLFLFKSQIATGSRRRAERGCLAPSIQRAVGRAEMNAGRDPGNMMGNGMRKCHRWWRGRRPAVSLSLPTSWAKTDRRVSSLSSLSMFTTTRASVGEEGPLGSPESDGVRPYGRRHHEFSSKRLGSREDLNALLLRLWRARGRTNTASLHPEHDGRNAPHRSQNAIDPRATRHPRQHSI